MFRRPSDLFRGVMMLICMTISLTILMEMVSNDRKKQLKGQSIPDDTSCYNETWKDEVFEEIRQKVILPNSIFFHDTSCRRSLLVRQACAVESAARSYPDRKIIIIFTKPVTGQECSRGLLGEIYKLQNVDFSRVNLNTYALGTPLEKVFKKNLTRNGTHYYRRRVAEYLKFLTLYRYGGTVIDLDLMVTPKMYYLLPYWVVKEKSQRLGSAIVTITKHNIGQDLARQFLSALAEQATSDDADGGRAMYEVLKRHCNTSDVDQMTFSNCGVHVHDSDILYPMNQSTWLDYLKPLAETYGDKYAGYHILNSEENDKMVPLGSLYAKIAQKYCPNVFNRFISEIIEPNVRSKVFFQII